jgi:predicted helicase
LYKHKFAKVWPFSEWPDKPDDWSPKATGSKENGTNIIAEDVHWKIWAIQAKFNPTDNQVTTKEVDTFLADSALDIIHYRILICTTDNIAKAGCNKINRQEKP